MRLLTWNCSGGEIDRRVERLRSLNADIIALQECRKPSGDDEAVIWRGTLEQRGVAVIAATDALRVEPMPIPADFPASVLPVVVHAPQAFVLINVWALREPTYEAFVLKALSMCAVGVSLPVVALGDFNSSPVVESQRRTSRELLRRLHDEFGLVSTYHSHLGVPHGHEPDPTFFMNRQENRPFHLDYCFVPEGWLGGIRSVEVGNFGDWPDSDHRPLVIEHSP